MKPILFLIALLFGSQSWALNQQSLSVSAKEKNFEIMLPANPTTGYQWNLTQYDKKLLTLKSSNYQKPETGLIGAGGTMHYVFLLKKGVALPASTKIKFVYARSWEKTPGSETEVTVNFTN